MVERMIKLPDVGEGVAEVEIVEWHVKAGDPVREGDVLAAVMTDKATVEIPSPVDGRVLWMGAEVGQKAAVGSEFIKLETGGSVDSHAATRPRTPATVRDGRQRPSRAAPEAAPPTRTSTSPSRANPRGSRCTALNRPAPGKPADRPIAAPAVRAYARDQGVDLRFVPGSGPASRILREDVDAYVARGGQAAMPHLAGRPIPTVEEIKIIGLRRKIAQRLQDTKRRVPHFTYIEEVDVTDLEALRADVNVDQADGPPASHGAAVPDARAGDGAATIFRA